MKISHQDLKAIIRGDIQPDRLSDLTDAVSKEPASDLLLGIVRDLQKKAGALPPGTPGFYSTVEISTLLESYFSGNITPPDAARLLNALSTSSESYRKCLRILNHIHPETEADPAFSFEGEFSRQLSDRDIVEKTIREAFSSHGQEAEEGARVHRLSEIPQVPSRSWVQSPWIGYAVAAGLALLLLFKPAATDSPFSAYLQEWQSNLPNPGAGVTGTLRTGGESVPVPEDLRAIQEALQDGTLRYLTHQHSEALAVLGTVRQDAETLAFRVGNDADSLSARRSLVLETYFLYSGLANLALSAETEKEGHLNAAIVDFNLAILQARAVGNPHDASSFYLGVTYGQDGDFRSAREQFNSISASSSYAQKARQLSLELPR